MLHSEVKPVTLNQASKQETNSRPWEKDPFSKGFPQISHSIEIVKLGEEATWSFPSSRHVVETYLPSLHPGDIYSGKEQWPTGNWWSSSLRRESPSYQSCLENPRSHLLGRRSSWESCEKCPGKPGWLGRVIGLWSWKIIYSSPHSMIRKLARVKP